MKNAQNKNTKKIYIATAVAAVAAVCLIIGIYAGAKNGFAEKNSCPVSVASVEKAAVKSAPTAIGLPKGSASGEVQISAQNEKWCRIEYSDKGTLKTGYIKTKKLADSPAEAEIGITGIELEATADAVSLGNTLEISAVTVPANASEAVVWSSSDADVATVENGAVTPISVGETYITATCKRASRTLRICVCAAEDGLSFESNNLELQRGESADLAKTVKNAADGEISWSTSNSKVAEIKNGKVSAVGTGIAVITAMQNGQAAQCSVSVTSANTHAKRALDMVNAYGDIYNYHPSTQYFAGGWNGYKYWCAFTPYKSNDDQWENPHILASNDLKNWEEPSGFSNPLEPKPENYEHGQVYNSDTELVYNTDTGLLECWWRFYDRPNHQVILRRKTTSDGVHWSEKEDMVVGEMGKYDFLSPALVYENGTYKMWAINQNTGHSIDYRESADGKNWGEIRKITVEYDDKELAHWHLDVIRTAKGYEMSISAYYPAENDRVHMSLYYSYSPDNVTYTKARLLFAPLKGTGAWDNMGLYRSSLLFAGGKYYLYYSGLNDSIGPSGMGLIGGTTPFSMGDING